MVGLCNFSKKAVRISLDCDDQIAQLAKNFLSVTPLTEVLIPPREKAEFELRFKPTLRLHEFSQDLKFKLVENQEKRNLLTVKGQVHGVELKLLEQTVGFGAVVVNSKLTRTIQLSNLGDIGCHFSWDTRFCRRFFTIAPESGFLPPHDELNLDITFHPDVIDNDIRFMKVKCAIQESDPIFINLIGKCIQQPQEHIQELAFETEVRKPNVQTVQVRNPSQTPWRIKVQCAANSDAFKGYFRGEPLLEVAPGQSAEYAVHYLPLSMTRGTEGLAKAPEAHFGSLFFPLPDGSALLYHLKGTALRPRAEQTLEVAFKAKQSSQHALQVKNWLPQNQRFAVSWEIENQDPGLFVNGANTIDMAPLQSKEYKITFYSLKPL